MARFDFLSPSDLGRSVVPTLAAIVMLGTLSACSGGSTSAALAPTPAPASAPDPTPTTPAQITGVSLPSSVSVVTAKNAD